MCGIVAFKGKSFDAGKVVFEGLKLLEYRGYDSAGVALLSENNCLLYTSPSPRDKTVSRMPSSA